MIRFEQTGDGTPKDILVITDDTDDELAEMEDALYEASYEDSETFKRLCDLGAAKDGEYQFTIPADEAGDVGDVFEECDNPSIPLAAFLQECNDKAIQAAEEHAE